MIIIWRMFIEKHESGMNIIIKHNLPECSSRNPVSRWGATFSKQEQKSWNAPNPLLPTMSSRTSVRSRGSLTSSTCRSSEVEITSLATRWGKILFVSKSRTREALWRVRSLVTPCFPAILKVLIENLYLRFVLLNCHKTKTKFRMLLFQLNKVCQFSYCKL